MFESFCCCISLRTGARCVGVIYAIIGIIAFIRSCLMFEVYVGYETIDDSKEVDTLLVTVICIGIIHALCVIIFSCALLRCIFTKNHNGIRYWLYFEIGSLVVIQLFNFITKFLPAYADVYLRINIVKVMLYTAVIVIQIYFILVVYSYYNELVAEQNAEQNVKPIATIQIIGKSKNEILYQDEVKYNRF